MANFKIVLTSAYKFVNDLYTDDVSIKKNCKKKIYYLCKEIADFLLNELH